MLSCYFQSYISQRIMQYISIADDLVVTPESEQEVLEAFEKLRKDMEMRIKSELGESSSKNNWKRGEPHNIVRKITFELDVGEE